MVTADQWRELEVFWQLEAEVNPESTLSAFGFQHRYDISSWSLKLVNHTLELMMARGKAGKQSEAGSNGAQWTTFVDIPLSGVSISDIELEYGDADTLVDAVSTLCGSGYRVGLSYNPQNDAFIASVTCRDADSPNSGKTFTAFAETWYQALQVAVYKHWNIAGEIWPEKGVTPNKTRFG